MVLLAMFVAAGITAVEYRASQPDRETGVISVEDNGQYTAQFLSENMEIERNYASMQGPYDVRHISLAEDDEELLWLTEYNVTVVDETNTPLPSQQYFCHAQIMYETNDLFLKKNERLFSGTRSLPPKWFVVVPGQSGVHFPEGFGLPMYSNEPLQAMTMALNQNPDFEPFTLKMRTSLSYYKDAELRKPMKPLGRFGVAVRLPVLADGPHHAEESEHSCSVTDADGVVTFAKSVSLEAKEKNGALTTPHFFVAPGTYTYKQQFKGIDQLPFDTTLHHITAHLHPYGKSIELWDTTENTMLFRSEASVDSRSTHVTNMTEYSDINGIPVYTDHDYELRAVYENTSGKNIDAMAVMYFYFHDRNFAA